MFFSCHRGLNCVCKKSDEVLKEVEEPFCENEEVEDLKLTEGLSRAIASVPSPTDRADVKAESGVEEQSEQVAIVEPQFEIVAEDLKCGFTPLEQDVPIFELDAQRLEAAAQHLDNFRPRVEAELLNSDEHQRRFCSEATLLRYLSVCGGSETKALAMLKETLKWREKNLADSLDKPPSQLACPCCQKDPTSHCFLHIGEDAAGRPVIYSCAGRASNKTVADGMRHMSLELERLFEGNSLPGRIVWVVDFLGFGLADCNPRAAYAAIPLFANHYPERFAQIVLFAMPSIFRAIYHSAMKILDPVMRRKVVVLDGEETRRRYSDRYWLCNPPMAAWLDAVVQCEGVPGSYPDISLSRGLSVPCTREFLERCAALRKQKGKR